MKATVRDMRALTDEEIHDAGGMLAEGLRAAGPASMRALADGFDRLTVVELRNFFETATRRNP